LDKSDQIVRLGKDIESVHSQKNEEIKNIQSQFGVEKERFNKEIGK